MSTPIQQKIRDKKRTPEQIAGMVKSGDWINHGTMGGGRRYPSYDDRRNYRLPLHSEIWSFGWDPFQSGK